MTNRSSTTNNSIVMTTQLVWKLLLFLLLFLTTAAQLVNAAERILTSLPAIEAFRSDPANANRFERVSNVDVIVVNDGNTNSSTDLVADDDEDLVMTGGKSICHIMEMNRYSMMAGPTRIAFPADYPLECLAAVALALEHLNTGNGSIVPEVDGLNERCDIRFTSEFIDTVGSPTEAVDQVISAIQRGGDNEQQEPCAFLGAFRSQVNIATALYTSLKGYPQISTLTAAPELDNKDIYPLYGSLTPSNSAIPFLEFCINVLQINHLAVLYPDNASGLSWMNPLREAVNDLYTDGDSFKLFGIGYSSSITTDFATTIQLLKESGYRYIYLVSGTDEYEAIMREAYAQGVAGTEEHTWITWVGIPVTFLLNKEFEPDDPIYLTGRQLIIFDSTIRSISGVGKYNEFLEKRAELANNPDDLAYLQSKIPKHPNDPAYNPEITPAILGGVGRFTGTSAVLYDATIAIGLAACTNAAGGAETTPTITTGEAIYQAFLNTSFVGASGTVELDPKTGSRKSKTNLYAMSNILPVPADNASGNMTLTELKTHIYENGAWDELKALTFVDGSQTPLTDIPPEQVDENHLGVPLRSVGMTMAGIIFVMSLGCSLWTLLNGGRRIVRASQPIFLWLICLGTAMMGSSLISLSMGGDETLSDKGADTACATIPWLISLGWCVSFSALFSKTKRINTIFHNPSFRRVKVEAVDVMKPMVVLLVLNVTILGVWTGLYPFRWERDVISYDDFGRAEESVGSCSSEKFWAFAAPLIVIDLGALVYSMQQAYVARKISTEFSESEWIFRAMTFITLVSFVTMPVLIIAEENPRSSYFVECALVFVVCMSLLCFIFIPKMLVPQTKSFDTKEAVRKSLQMNALSETNGGSSANNNGGQQGTQEDSAFTMDRSSLASDYDGALRIVEHPRMNEELREELRSLKKAKSKLEKEVAELRGADGENVDPNSILDDSSSSSGKAHRTNMTGEIVESMATDGQDDNESV